MDAPPAPRDSHKQRPEAHSVQIQTEAESPGRHRSRWQQPIHTIPCADSPGAHYRQRSDSPIRPHPHVAAPITAERAASPRRTLTPLYALRTTPSPPLLPHPPPLSPPPCPARFQRTERCNLSPPRRY
ncbi:sterile alpha motif domain-containing protein 1-like [Ischnura elegans]|uniref:sterile alpha motif domain-containing protein 1-like n=1 Tax=Ischnura elegans TaxID=197161 RepID=UPI001ED86D72|nr:sterile alpha motif domain-containing protein 1-like [Ischnura elegans]